MADDEEYIRRYLTLSTSLLRDRPGRASATDLLSYRLTESATAKVIVSHLAQHKSNLARVPREAQKYLLDPTSFHDLLANSPADGIWLFDQSIRNDKAVDMQNLGTGLV